MPDADTSNLHPVACESCRSRKCKCDRNLPCCSQCNKSGSICTYPQTFKRGFPEGYLNGLEQRLLQTELALFEILSLSFDRQSAEAQLHYAKILQSQNEQQTKAERMQEWSRLPLDTPNQRFHWWSDKISRINPSFNHSRVDGPSTSPVPDHDTNSIFRTTHTHSQNPNHQSSQHRLSSPRNERDQTSMRSSATSETPKNVHEAWQDDVSLPDVGFVPLSATSVLPSSQLQDVVWSSPPTMAEVGWQQNAENTSSQAEYPTRKILSAPAPNDSTKAQSLSSRCSRKFF